MLCNRALFYPIVTATTTSLPLVGQEPVENRGDSEKGARRYGTGQYWQFLSPSCQCEYVAYEGQARCLRPLYPTAAHAMPQKIQSDIGDVDTLQFVHEALVADGFVLTTHGIVLPPR